MIRGEFVDPSHFRREEFLSVPHVFDHETATAHGFVVDPGESRIFVPGFGEGVSHGEQEDSRILRYSVGCSRQGENASMLKTLCLFAFGAACLVRGLRNPVRALVRAGALRRCEGTNSFGICDPSLEITTNPGEPVYSVAEGTVIFQERDFVHVLSLREPVILFYQGVKTSLRAGDPLHVGEPLGESEGELIFSVTQVGPGGLSVIPPSTWLAARGFSPVQLNTGTTSLWCAQGRTLQVPKSSCQFRAPEKSGFSLFPVNIDMQS